MSTYKPGDRCVFIRLPEDPKTLLVQHYRCDQHADGTITDPRTGKVVSR